MYFSFWGSNPIQPIKILQQNMHLFYGYWRTVTFTFGTTRWPQNRRLWSGIHLAIRSRWSPVERCVLCSRWSFFPFDFLLIVFSVGCTLILVRASPLVTPARLRLGKFLAKWKPGREKHHHFWLCFCVVLPEPDPKSGNKLFWGEINEARPVGEAAFPVALSALPLLPQRKHKGHRVQSCQAALQSRLDFLLNPNTGWSSQSPHMLKHSTMGLWVRTHRLTPLVRHNRHDWTVSIWRLQVNGA